MSAFSGGTAAAAMLLLLCASHASASKIEPDCAHQRADRSEALNLAGEALEDRLGESGFGRSRSESSPLPTKDGDRVPPSPEFEAVMTRILEVAVLDGVDDERQSVDDADVSPIAEADIDADAAERPPGDVDWASDSAHLPGLSDAAAERYRRQMYRTDI